MEQGHGMQEGAFPGPLAEVEWWAGREGDLRSISAQLAGEGVAAVAKALQAAASSYHPALMR